MLKMVPEQKAAAMYTCGFQPYRDILERLILPRRYPKGSKRNFTRSLHVMAALHKQKHHFKHCGLDGCPLCKVRIRLSN